MTKNEYIKTHSRSKLAQVLITNTWPDDTDIEIIGGLNAPCNKCSNLYHALQRSVLHDYEIGGHRRMGTEGWWMAVA